VITFQGSTIKVLETLMVELGGVTDGVPPKSPRQFELLVLNIGR